jgi:hypothetical protein
MYAPSVEIWWSELELGHVVVVAARHAADPMMNCGKNVRLKPMKMMPPRVAEASLYITPNIFGHQCAATEEGDRGAAHHHVVEVRDDEVGVVQVDVDAHRPPRKMPGEAADREEDHRKPASRASACRSEIEPL